MKHQTVKTIIACFILSAVLYTTYIFGTTSDATNKVTYNCNGSAVEFTFTFPIVDTSDMVVILRTVSTGAETVLTETTHYSLSATNNDYSSGGTVTTVSTYSSSYTLTLIRNVPESQGATLEDSGVLRLATLEGALDRLTLQVQDLEEEVGRCLKFPRTETNSAELDSSVDRASTALGFDSSGDLEYN